MALAETARLIAALELQDKFSGPARNVDRSIGGLERSVGRLDRVGSAASRGIGTLTGNVIKLGSLATGAVVGSLTLAVHAASDLNEEIDKSTVVFGPAAAEVQKFADGAAAIGLSKAEALGAAGAFGNMFNTVGLAKGESADMSETMVQLASDMASFNNEDPSEMLDKLRSGLSGEAEPLRRFGVLLSEATVKDFAYRKGIAKSGEALTEAQKVQARYGLILEQTTIQQGNFADTSDGLANQQRILRANLSNTAATIGTALLPSVGKLASKINELFIDKQPQIAAFGERIGEALGKILTDANIDRAIGRIGDFIDKLAEGDISASLSGFGGVISGLGSLPWAQIGDAARLLGTGSKAMLDAFLGLPPWVQTAVLTGWGLNKLTGGALSSIFGTLASGLIKGILNMNAGVVNLTAGTVTGAGGGTGGAGGGGGRGLLGFLGLLGAGLTGAGIGAAIQGPQFQAETSAGAGFLGGTVNAVIKGGTLPEQERALAEIERQMASLNDGTQGLPAELAYAFDAGGLKSNLTAQRDALRQSIAKEERIAGYTRDAIPWAQRNRESINNLNASEGRRASAMMQRAEATRQAVHTLNANEGSRAATAHARLQAIRDIEAGNSGKLSGILAKKWTANVNVPITLNSYVSASLVQQGITRQTTYNGYTFSGSRTVL